MLAIVIWWYTSLHNCNILDLELQHLWDFCFLFFFLIFNNLLHYDYWQLANSVGLQYNGSVVTKFSLKLLHCFLYLIHVSYFSHLLNCITHFRQSLFLANKVPAFCVFLLVLIVCPILISSTSVLLPYLVVILLCHSSEYLLVSQPFSWCVCLPGFWSNLVLFYFCLALFGLFVFADWPPVYQT